MSTANIGTVFSTTNLESMAQGDKITKTLFREIGKTIYSPIVKQINCEYDTKRIDRYKLNQYVPASARL